MCFKNGVQINISHAHFLQVGQFFLNTGKIAAKIIQIQAAAGFCGPKVRLTMLVGTVNTVGERHGLGAAFLETIRKDLILHAAFIAFGRDKILVIYRDLPFGAAFPAEIALAKLAAVDLAKITVQIKMIKV